MKIDTVYFRDQVRVHGNVYLSGVTPDDIKRRMWSPFYREDERLVELVPLEDNRLLVGQIFYVPLENVSCMRQQIPDGVAKKKR